MKLWQIVSSQFGKPAGLLGKAVGIIMSRRGSNIERNAWVISLLNLQESDRVLEIGFGPGVAIKMMSRIVKSGTIYGLDHSAVMYHQAEKRNQDAITNDTVILTLGAASGLPAYIFAIDKVLAVNSLQFWESPVAALKSLKSVMTPGGIIAIAHQPRKPGATNEDAEDEGRKYAGQLEIAGFHGVRVEKREMRPVSTICVLGRA